MIKKALLIFTVVSLALMVWLYATPLNVAHSQGEIDVQCGQEFPIEFTGDKQEHIYMLSVEPRWSFNVTVVPYGDDLKTVIALYGPTDNLIAVADGYDVSWGVLKVLKSPTVSSGVLSSRGPYKIRVANTAITYGKLDARPENFGGTGFYTLQIGCTTNDGTKIRPGENPLPTPTPVALPTQALPSALPETPPAFTGIGFPGLPPVDFTSAITAPLPLGESVTGIMPLDEQILAFALEAEKDDTLDLSYIRSSGNMNLGLVVLSESNNVIFQASLVTSESLSTRFILPEAGEYTIGVFRISLVEPAQAKPTLFKIKGVLNPAE